MGGVRVTGKWRRRRGDERRGECWARYLKAVRRGLGGGGFDARQERHFAASAGLPGLARRTLRSGRALRVATRAYEKEGFCSKAARARGGEERGRRGEGGGVNKCVLGHRRRRRWAVAHMSDVERASVGKGGGVGGAVCCMFATSLHFLARLPSRNRGRYPTRSVPSRLTVRAHALPQVDWWTDEAHPAAEAAATPATLVMCESLLSVPVRAGGRPDGAVVGVLQACNRLRSKSDAAAAALAAAEGGGGGGGGATGLGGGEELELDPEGFGEADEGLMSAFASAIGIGLSPFYAFNPSLHERPSRIGLLSRPFPLLRNVS